MIAWQHSARLGFAVFTAVFAGVVYFAMGTRPPAPTSVVVERADPNAVIESTGAVVTQAKGTDEDFKIEAARQLTYADGASRLEDVRITVAKRAGRTFIVTGQEADIAPNREVIELDGDVRIVADDGFTMLTDHATFREGDGMLRMPGHVEFSRERLVGSSQGATYDRARDVIWLLDEARVTIAPAEDGAGGTAIASRAASVARAEGYMRFDDDVRIERTNEIIEARTVYAYFTEAQDRIELVELRGNSSVTGREGAPGTLQAMRGNDIDLLYADDGQALRETTLVGNASIAVLGGSDTAARGVAADWLDVGFGADGQTVERLTGERNVVLDFERTGTTPARRISAAAIEGGGAPGAGLTMLELTGGVEQRETDPEDGSVFTVKASTLALAVAPGLGDVETAKFSGDVTFEQGAMSGTADVANYDMVSGAIALRMANAEAANAVAENATAAGGSPAELSQADAVDVAEVEDSTTGDVAAVQPARRPTVTDERAVIEADEIDLAASGAALRASGEVQTVMHARDPAEEPTDDAQAGGRRPAMLTDDAPVYVTAVDLEYERATGRAVYTGGARLWQGETTIQGDSITLDDESGDLTADGAARSIMALDEGGTAPAVTGGPESAPVAAATEMSLATAERLVYDEASRVVTYHGVADPTAVAVPVARGATPSGPPGAAVSEPWILAHVTGPQGALSARRIELFLKADGRTLERVEAYDDVKLRTEYVVTPEIPPEAPVDVPVEPVLEQRDALGERMTYFVADERYVMHGQPVTIIEKCRETQGNSLTFFKAVDTINIDGNAEIRTQTRAGSDCAEPPSL